MEPIERDINFGGRYVLRKAIGHRDIGKLVRKVIVNRAGIRQTVFVLPYGAEAAKKKKREIEEKLTAEQMAALKLGERIENIGGFTIYKNAPNAIGISGKDVEKFEAAKTIAKKLGVGKYIAERKEWAFPVEYTPIVLGEIGKYFEEKERGKTEPLKEPAAVERHEKAEAAADAEALREGYMNEKPAEILNVGKDVYGAARHAYDTYDADNVRLKQMEEDGTAEAYVNKRKLIGPYGVANEQERIAKGETPAKVILSYGVRDILASAPGGEGNTDSDMRNKYYSWCQAVRNLDEQTKTSEEYMEGLARAYTSIFGEQNALNEATASGTIGDETVMLIRGWQRDVKTLNTLKFMGKDRRFGKVVAMLALNFYEKAPHLTDKDPTAGARTIVYGVAKATGVKVSKGDRVDISGMPEKPFVSERKLTPEEREKWDSMRAREAEFAEEFSKIFNDFHGEKERGAIESRLAELFSKFGYTEPFETRKASDIRWRLLEKMYAERNKIGTLIRHYADDTGTVVRLKGGQPEVMLRFADGKSRIVTIPRDQIKQESVERKEREKTTKSKPVADLYRETKVAREGGADFSKQTPAQLQKHLHDEYGIKALQYGNSMNDNERAYHTRWTAEAMSDLREVMGLPMKAMTGNGKLGIAYGARGGPMSISRVVGAAAHYEPDSKMVNLTRAHGIGALAHELGHFFDYSAAEHRGTASNGDIHSKEEVRSIGELKKGDIIEHGKGKRKARWSYDPEGAKGGRYNFAMLRAGQTEPDAGAPRASFPEQYFSLGAQSGHVAVVQRRIVREGKIYDLAQNIATEMGYNFIQQRNEFFQKQGKNPIAEMVFGAAESGPHEYWSSPNECFARAFEFHISDELHKAKRMNTYLVSRKTTQVQDGAVVYPQGEARQRISGMVREFINELKSTGVLEKAVRVFCRMVLQKSDDAEDRAMDHGNKLGEGAKKRRKLRAKRKKVRVVMREFERGTLHSGSGHIVTDRAQAQAIAYSEAGLSRKK